MDDMHNYTLVFFGQVDDEFLTSYCPDGASITQENQTTTVANIYTDQAGILGVFRVLHNLGCTIQSLTCN